MVIQRTTIWKWNDKSVRTYYLDNKEDKADFLAYLAKPMGKDVYHEEWHEVRYISPEALKQLVGQVKG